MLKIFQSVVLLLFIAITGGNIIPQSTSEFEISYNYSKNNLEKEKYVLDSLKLLLNEKANLIDYEKNKKNVDKDKIVALMSSSVVISNKYESQQKKVKQLGKKVESIEKELSKRYTAIIDSLQSLQSSGELTGDKEKIDSEVLLYIEKKLAVVPRISLLSFDPVKLLKIDHGKTKDTLENVIYQEYLQNAYAEVNTYLANVDEHYSEINHIILLQKKTEKFLKEAEFENGIRTESSTSGGINTEANRDGSFIDPTVLAENKQMIEQFRGYTLLLNQLNLGLSTGNKFDWQIESMDGSSSLSLKQYKKVLEDLKKKLQDYKLVLGNKIGTHK